MKNYIFPVICFLALISCEENETIYSIDPALDPYVSTFYAEAEERGVIIPKNLIAEIKPGQSMVEAYTQHDQNYLYFHPTSFGYYIDKGQESSIEAHIYNRLGGLFLKRSPILDSLSLVNPLYWECSPDDSLSFMNPKIRFGGYDPIYKEALFDELFQNN